MGYRDHTIGGVSTLDMGKYSKFEEQLGGASKSSVRQDETKESVAAVDAIRSFSQTATCIITIIDFATLMLLVSGLQPEWDLCWRRACIGMGYCARCLASRSLRRRILDCFWYETKRFISTYVYLPCTIFWVEQQLEQDH